MKGLRKAHRGWLSSIDLLPPSCAEDVLWLRVELTVRSRTQAVILAEFNARIAERGQKAISKSAFSRFSIAHTQQVGTGAWDEAKKAEVAKALQECGFVDPEEAKRAVHRARLGNLIGDPGDLIKHDIEQERFAIMPVLLRSLHLAASDLNRCADMLRRVDAAGGCVGQDELLERVEVVLQLVEALFNRVGQESVSINDAGVGSVATGEKLAAHRLSGDAK